MVFCQVRLRPRRESKILEKEMYHFPKVEIVQSTYESPPYKNLGMEQIFGREQQRRDQEAVLGVLKFFLDQVQ